MGDGELSVLEWYVYLLSLFDEGIRRIVDQYNNAKDILPNNLVIALEIVDGLPLED